MKIIDFEVGKQIEQERLGKAQWATQLRIAMPRRQAWRIVKDIIAQLEYEDDGCSGVAIVLHGEILEGMSIYKVLGEGSEAERVTNDRIQKR